MNLVKFPFSAEELHLAIYEDQAGLRGLMDVYAKDEEGRLAVRACMVRRPYSGTSVMDVFEFDAIAASKLKFDSEKAAYSPSE